MRAILPALLIGAVAAAACSRPSTAQPTSAASQPAAAPASTSTSTAAAAALAASLSGPARDKAMLAFDAPERVQMNYIPIVRAGVPLNELAESQQSHAWSLLRAGLSETGFATARSIVSHEDILRDLEQSQGAANYMRRQPGLYYTALFGTPGADAAWGWRFEGHHLSVNVTHAGAEGEIVAPLFMGSNPAKVPSGPKAGLRILAAEEDAARALLTLFDEAQKALVVIAPETTNDIVSKNLPKVEPMQFAGLAVKDMTAPQQKQLRALLDVYASRLPAAQKASQLARMEKAGFNTLHFAWAGGTAVGQKHYYRIHGPTLLVEYDNSQNDGNHVHSVWRDLQHDYGGDLLRKHLATHKH